MGLHVRLGPHERLTLRFTLVSRQQSIFVQKWTLLPHSLDQLCCPYIYLKSHTTYHQSNAQYTDLKILIRPPSTPQPVDNIVDWCTVMDQQLKIKSYTPDTSSYSPRIRNEQWNEHKSLLKHLHDEGYKRADMLSILRKQGFSPSMGQLNAKMTAWGFKVYGTQSESRDTESGISPQTQILDTSDAGGADLTGGDIEWDPDPHGSISSMTLFEPEKHWDTPMELTNHSLDQAIRYQALALHDSYWPISKPSDFGLRAVAAGTQLSEPAYQCIVLVADFLCAVHCFEQAFDLYYYVFDHLVADNIANHPSLVRTLIQCATTAATDAQCDYIMSIVRQAHAYCAANLVGELTMCFSSLVKDLGNTATDTNDYIANTQDRRSKDLPLLISLDVKADVFTYRRESLYEQLTECDKHCGTLVHLSVWCQDVLSYFGLENNVIGGFVPGPSSDNDTSVFEHDFQTYVSGLIIDYLNSPGPNLKKAAAECKEDGCPFRWALSPSTSLIVMVHLLYEPLRLQFQSTTNQYLQSRAQHYSNTQSTTALQELKAFAAAPSVTRCSAFVDTFMKHFNTTFVFRRFASNTTFQWDRIVAAKRLAHILQSNQSGLLPHAGLPSARRSTMRTMVAPAGLDMSATENRPSVISESGSTGEFARYASQINGINNMTGFQTPSDAMSIDTKSSWSFGRVTGFANPSLSARNSLSSRRGEQDEMDEYRHFIKENNYSQQTLANYPDTPTQRHAQPSKRDL